MNWRIKALQASALPLGYGAITYKLLYHITTDNARNFFVEFTQKKENLLLNTLSIYAPKTMTVTNITLSRMIVQGDKFLQIAAPHLSNKLRLKVRQSRQPKQFGFLPVPEGGHKPVPREPPC